MASKDSDVKTQNLLIGLGVILLILAGIFYFNSKKKPEIQPSPSPEEIIIQQEGTVKKTGEVVQPLSDEEIKKMREEIDSVLSTAGITAVLKEVSGGWANGEAKKAFSDGKFYLRITAKGLIIASKGYYYEGWLEKDDTQASIGRINVDEMGNGVLYYTSSADRSDYAKVFVSLEPEDGNPALATKVLEGSF